MKWKWNDNEMNAGMEMQRTEWTWPHLLCLKYGIYSRDIFVSLACIISAIRAKPHLENLSCLEYYVGKCLLPGHSEHFSSSRKVAANLACLMTTQKALKLIEIIK
jgi:hypothetical protein